MSQDKEGPGVMDVIAVTNWYNRYQALLHENERLRARPAPWVPAVHIRCDGRCGAVVAFDPAPEEAAMTQALVALGWLGHWCRGCRNAG